MLARKFCIVNREIFSDLRCLMNTLIVYVTSWLEKASSSNMKCCLLIAKQPVSFCDNKKGSKKVPISSLGKVDFLTGQGSGQVIQYQNHSYDEQEMVPVKQSVRATLYSKDKLDFNIFSSPG